MRSWLVIPATGAAGGAIALGGGPAAIAAGLAAAATAHAVRTLAGDGVAGLVGAALAGVLAVVSMLDRSGVAGWLALAATAWTIASLAGGTPAIAGRAKDSPLVALLPATLAAVLAPGCVALVAFAGARLVLAPRSARWTIAVPAAGCIAVVVAVIAGASGGAFWFGPPHPVAPAASIAALADALGPLAAVAALAGLAVLARAQLANLALLACAAGALLVDLRAGGPGPITLGLAALSTGVAVGRFAGQIRLATGQAIVGTTCSAMLLLAPAMASAGSGARSDAERRAVSASAGSAGARAATRSVAQCRQAPAPPGRAATRSVAQC